MTNKVQGAGINPTYVANSILARSFRDHIPITPMKLQKLLFFTACLYERHTSRRLLSEGFQTWRYGPVSPSVYAEFKGFGGKPINRYAQDALSHVYRANEKDNHELAYVLNMVWGSMSGIGAIQLSRITHRPGSAWDKAFQNNHIFISDDDMANDHTFDDVMA